MRTDSLRVLDRWFALPLCLITQWMNHSLDVLCAKHQAQAQRRTICLAKFAGMGSILNTVPFLRALRLRYPSAHIVYLTFARHKELVQRLSPVNECLFIEDRSIWSLLSSIYSTSKRLRRLNLSCYVDLQYYTLCYFSVLIAGLSGASEKVGFIRQPSLRKRRFLTRPVYFNAFQPLQEAFNELAHAIGTELCAPALECEASLTTFSQDRKEIRRHLGPWLKPPKRLLVVNANASAACFERRWPRESFAETLSELLRRIPELQVVLTGDAGERDYVEGLRCIIGPHNKRVLNSAGMLSQGGLLALLREADCLLSNDSGPMHAGFALGIPTVALFGPANPQDHVAQADPRKTVIFYKRVFCSPCIHIMSPPPCGGHNACMQLIPVASVRDACLALLTGTALRDDLVARWKWPTRELSSLSHKATVPSRA